MKKTSFFILSFLLISSVVFAQGQGNGQGEQIQTEQQTQNQGEEGQLMVTQQVTAGQINEVKQQIQQKEQEMNQEIEAFKEKKQEVYQNQNEVRLAVHSLLAMEGLVGGIGNQVSQIAQEFNNSVQATIKAEEKIQNRNMIVSFFMGGDQEAAGKIEQEVNQNRLKIQQLKQLYQQCDCDEEIKNMFQEQVENMEQEQNRLQQVASQEKKIRGIWGWLKGLFGR